MGSAHIPVSTLTYKGMEAEIRSILLPRGADPLTITAKDIRNATHRILQSDKTPMTKRTLSRLRDMTKQRRAVFNQFCEGGSLCHGHLYWIELWESVHKALLDHFNFVTSRDTTTMMEPLTNGPSDASLRDILTRLDEEAGRLDRSDELYTIANAEALHDRPTVRGGTGSGHGKWKHHPKTSFNQVHEEVLLGTSLDCIRGIGDWLKTIWRDVAESRLDFATVAQLSNCARDLVRREYHEIDLLYGWTKHPIFQQHPLAQEIENVAEAAAWQEIISYQHINKAFEAPVLRDISNSKPELQDVVSIDRWLVSCTTEAWLEVSEGEHSQLPTARTFLLIRILRTQLNQLRSQTPTLFFGGELEGSWIRAVEESLDVAQRESLPPPWGLCDLAAHIVSKRWEIESYCVESLALFRIRHTFTDDSTDSKAVRDWLLDRYQTQLYPLGRPKSKIEASLPIRGKSAKGKYKKCCERMIKNWPLVTVLKKQTLKDVLQRLQKIDTSWGGLHDPLDILNRLRPLFEKENSTVFDLDGKGWDAVGLPEEGKSLVAQPICSVENLELSKSRAKLVCPSDKFDTEIPDIAVLPFTQSFVDPRSGVRSSSEAFLARGGFCSSSSGIYHFYYHPYDLSPGTGLDTQNSAWVTVNQRFAFNENDIALRKDMLAGGS